MRDLEAKSIWSIKELSEMEQLEIRQLSQSLLQERLKDLVRLDGDLIREYGDVYSHEIWREKNYALDLPSKWTLSVIAFKETAVAGFWIASQKDRLVHSHRVGVEKASRHLGVGKKMFKSVLQSGRLLGLEEMTVFVSVQNKAAILFYENLGFQRLEGNRARQFLQETGHDGLILGGRVEEPAGYQYYVYALSVDNSEGRP